MENELPVQYTKGMINSDIYTRKYFDSFTVEMRLIDSKLADTSVHFLGADFKTPIMIGVTHYPKTVEGLAGDVGIATAEIGSAVCFSMRAKDEDVQRAVAQGAKVIIIIKPYRDNQKVIDTIHHFEELGVFAVGCDIDHAYNKNGEMDGQGESLFGPKTMDELKELVQCTKLPFIAKGVLSSYDAVKCKEAGVAAICVSHHHSIMDDAVPPLMVLPEIRKAVGPDYPIAIDCGVINGADAFKCLALGADVVWIARAIMAPMGKEGAEGAKKVVTTMTGELRHYMDRTSSPDTKHIDSSVLHQVQFNL